MKIKLGTIILISLFQAFLVSSLVYFYRFSLDLTEKEVSLAGVVGAVNAHDHFYYLETIKRLEQDGFAYELNNDVGISYFYLFLNRFLFDGAADYIYISIFVNLAFLVSCFWCYLRLCDYYGFGLGAKVCFFAGFHLVYFAQLINKDMISVFLIVFSVYCSVYRRIWLLLFMLPFCALVRQQLFVYVVLFLFFYTAVQPMWRVLAAYIITSLVAAYLVVEKNIIGWESLEGGFSSIVYLINSETYLGYFIFNPIRILQFAQDALLSLIFVLPGGGVEMARLLRAPQVILLIFLAWPLYVSIKRSGRGMRESSKPLYSALFAFLLAWLMNPTINARYVMLITPVLVLLAFYARKNFIKKRV